MFRGCVLFFCLKLSGLPSSVDDRVVGSSAWARGRRLAAGKTRAVRVACYAL